MKKKKKKILHDQPHGIRGANWPVYRFALFVNNKPWGHGRIIMIISMMMMVILEEQQRKPSVIGNTAAALKYKHICSRDPGRGDGSD